MAGIKSALSGGGKTVKENLGLIERAVIEVIDIRDRKVIQTKAIRVVGGANSSSGGLGSSSFVNQGVLKDSLTSTLGEGLIKGSELTDRMIKNIADKSTRYYSVKFNPNTLSLSGHSGGLVQKMDYSEEGNQAINYTQGDTNIMLSVKLLFDQCDPQDAFFGDKVNPFPTSVLKGVAKAGLKAKGVKQLTLQKEVEGFIAALRNKYTRIITFHWGDINYSGTLKSVRAVYNMFNINGEPIRAEVDLSIMCADDSELSKAALQVWQQRYKNAFSKGSESFAYSANNLTSYVDKGINAIGSKLGGFF